MASIDERMKDLEARLKAHEQGSHGGAAMTLPHADVVLLLAEVFGDGEFTEEEHAPVEVKPDADPTDAGKEPDEETSH